MNYTYYDYLELPPGASPARIEAAYLALLERFGYGTSDAGQDLSGLVVMIHAAYQTLSNSEAREQYDATLAREAAMADAELKATLDQHENGARSRHQVAPESFREAFTAIAA
jgi:curved DNA-binding protein CbpA